MHWKYHSTNGVKQFIWTIYIYWIYSINGYPSVNDKLQTDTVGKATAQTTHLAAHKAVAQTMNLYWIIR